MKNKIIKAKNLVKRSQSMDQDEKELFLRILPTMNEYQVDDLIDIIEKEIKWLQEIEVQYQKDIKDIEDITKKYTS